MNHILTYREPLLAESLRYLPLTSELVHEMNTEQDLRVDGIGFRKHIDIENDLTRSPRPLL